MSDHQHLEDFFGLKPESEDPDKNQKKKEPLREAIKKNGPSVIGHVWLLPKVLSLRERYLIGILALVIIASVIALPFTIYYHLTTAIPANGGSFAEGLVGQPRYINPLLSQTNDADRDISGLIYSGLLKYNAGGQLIPDLAKSYELSPDGLNYTIYLKSDAVWSDGQPVTTDDVIYTIQTIQNIDYGSSLRVNWQGVEVQKVNNATLIFKLKNRYAQFLNNLTVGILPAHIWSKLQPVNFTSSEYNLKPIGSGPYVFKKLQKDANGRIMSYELAANNNYYDGRPHIDGIVFKFYNNEDQMLSAHNNNDIQNLAYVSPQNLKKMRFTGRLNVREIKLPRYFGVFFNQSQSAVLADKNVRMALNYATDKQTIIDTLLVGKGAAIYSPLIENVIETSQDIARYSYNIEQAVQILAAGGWTSGENGILKKGKQTLSIRLTAPTFSELASAANILKKQWSGLGISVTLDILPPAQLQQAIKERRYEALLFGEILNPDPDPFSLWHSSQINDPGLNLALYQNKSADSILESARQLANPAERLAKYSDFQNVVIADAPAVFLYNPLYLYPQSKSIKGFESEVISTPADRFSDIENWYIETSRTFDK
ncbi:MAG: hypothetical protein A2941_00085 [Candidatus Yanofskybacteria bacterium RIFCSPLOWO2_01_FULL_49_17]|uniref:Solute-binding protein family 5 domain-containing protein n=1 Tax=Candidatus Yanofskybacteria bacterium RIFCSPLOWO2_01_FULL_49_17 TaxID=1802700 RepID=A0A1F8GR25_9BACT|nr:MAG: hypothetical protein A2941_00085 [Candidatus Yanofskybacteria bacterium RIFCSPLOWO2_01_FULL_49_17]